MPAPPKTPQEVSKLLAKYKTPREVAQALLSTTEHKHAEVRTGGQPQ